MICYRISKYDPLKRHADGRFLDLREWTSISDIGKEQYGSPTYEDYERTESAYVQAIRLVLMEKGFASVQIGLLELHNGERDFARFESDGRLRNLPVEFDADIAGLVNNMEVPLDRVEQLSRLVLREALWLCWVAEGLEIKFGYDYYMYIMCEGISPTTIGQIEGSGLFVEPGVGQRVITIVDKSGREV